MEPIFYRLIYTKREIVPSVKGGSIMNTNAIVLGLIGIILAILGAAEFVVKGMPGRGSGIGTLMLIVGVLLLVVGFWRMNAKAAK